MASTIWSPGGLSVLGETAPERIIANSFTILEKIGMRVENDEICARLVAGGARLAGTSGRLTFPESILRESIELSSKMDWSPRPVTISSAAEIYQGMYLDPADGLPKEWTEARLRDYLAVVDICENVGTAHMLGCPLAESPIMLQPLYERFFAWKYGYRSGGSIWDSDLLDRLERIHHIYAEETGVDAQAVFQGTVWLISPLRFGAVEASQFLHFAKRGFRVHVGSNGALGGAFPVTLSGALSLQLAELLFIHILENAYFGITTIHLSTQLAATEMRTGALQYGRPEMILANLAMSQIARQMGAQFQGHCGLSDAKVPGHEAGVQKISSAFGNIMACGEAYVASGLLATDEICSPVQLLLDDEALGTLARVARGISAEKDDLAFDTIVEEVESGFFLASEHTALRFREELWQTRFWSTSMYSAWSQNGSRIDTDLARERSLDAIRTAEPRISRLTPSCEARLLAAMK